MKHVQLNRLVIFFSRYHSSWAGYSITWDYHNVIASVDLFTFQVGFEYVWKNSRKLKKCGYGWNFWRL